MNPEILLIDDDDDDQFIFLAALEDVAPGSHCHISNNAPEAFQYLNASAEIPDMLFLDLNMPLMNGFEFLLDSEERSQVLHCSGDYIFHF